jgi:hypothetical protein
VFLVRFDDLRGHPEDGALHRRERSALVLVVRALRDTKVGDLANAGVFNEDVVGLEILGEEVMLVTEHVFQCRVLYELGAGCPWNAGTPGHVRSEM